MGDAGRKLNYCLARAGLERKRCRIENVVRCRPPGNRKPSKKEREACWPFSWYQIIKHKPKVIVAMGATAIEQLSERVRAKRAGRVVEHWRGFYERRTFTWTNAKGVTLEHTCWVVPTYHPSLCLRAWEADELLVFDLLIAAELAAGREPLAWPDTKLTVLTNLTDVVRFLRHLRRVGRFATDIEDTSLQVHETTVMCMGFCYRAGQSTIIPWSRAATGASPAALGAQPPAPFWKPHEQRVIIDELTETLETCEVLGQNIKYDLQRYRKLTGLIDYRVAFDTMVAHHVLDENKPHNLTFLTQWFLGWKKYDAALEPYKEGKAVRMWLVPDAVRNEYCGYDVDGTYQLASLFQPMLAEDQVERVYQLEHDLILPLADMEYRGIQMNRARLVELADGARAEGSKALRRLNSMVQKLMGEEGATFNPGSTKQLAALLKLAGADLRKRTASGALSVDKFVLAALALKQTKAGAISRAIVNFRRMEKRISTYLDGRTVAGRGRGRPANDEGGFARWLQAHDRIHPNYNIAIARTGRLSADDPPIQTIPRTGDLRSMLVPDVPDEHVLVAVDYQKLELCIMAWLANDEVMVRELLTADVDLHTKMAVTARLMRDPTAQEYAALAPQIGKNERAIAKGVNFGIPYGRGAAAIAEANPDAFPLGMPKEDRRRKVQRIIDAYFEKYWRIAEYRERQIERLHARGRLRTSVHQRLRRLGGIDWYNSSWAMQCEQREYDLSHLEREALNCEIQSIGSDTLSEATKRVYDGIKVVRLPAFRIVMSLHDALLFNVHRRHAEEAQVHIRQWMEVTLPRDKRHKFEMPLTVDCTVQSFWGEGEA